MVKATLDVGSEALTFDIDFAIAQLQGTLPDGNICDNPERFSVFRPVLRSQEEQDVGSGAGSWRVTG